MACNSIKVFEYNPCVANLGGIKTVWLAEYKEGLIVRDGEGANVTDGEITALEGVTWTKYPMRKNVASMTSTLNNSTDGATYVTTELALVFSRMDADKRASIQALALGEVMALVEDNNGFRWFLGADAPLTATAGGGESGTAMSDANRYTITLTDESKEYPLPVSGSYKPTVSE
jgi:hypothetical protein